MGSDAALMQPEAGRKPSAKVRLLTLDDLDRRTRAASKTLDLRDSLASDLGGSEHLSTAEDQIVQRAAVLGGMAEDQEARWLRGEPIELGDYLAIVNCQRRELDTLGLERRARDITPRLGDYLAGKRQKEAEDA